jgi:aminoglycoside phosphotransferase (APT) family kinase protein
MADVTPEAPDGRRPQTSTRDPDELAGRLAAWLATRLDAVALPTVANVQVPASNGMSSETLLFDAAWTDDEGGHDRQLVARVAPDPAAVPVFPSYDLDEQFRTIKLVGEHSTAPVPQVFWSEPDAGPLGAPFFVMQRIDGQVPPDILPYSFGDNWLFDASATDQRRLQDSSIAVLAELHRVPDAATIFGFLPGGAGGEGDALEQHLAGQEAYYEWVAADGVRSPLIERALRWLRDHWPAHIGPTTLSWGDARVGNVLYRDFEPVAVLDWEMAALAPPEIDIGWFIFLHRFFEDLAQTYGFPGMAHFLRRDDVAATYEAMSGYAPRDLDWFTLYSAMRHGIVMFRIHRRQVQFGEATMPDDPDEMIPHRATIEAMLAGTYWPNVI